MRTSTKWIAGAASAALMALTASPSYAQQNSGAAETANGTQEGVRQTDQNGNLGTLQTRAQQALQTFKQTDPSLETFFQNAAGYAIFPTVGEGALIVGGAHGDGLVYENNKPIGKATVTKGTIGAQAGGESFSELIFFKTPQALQEFKQGKVEFSASANAVADKAGVGAATDYKNGVAVFTTSRAGLMAKAAIGGQKFTYQPLAMGAGGLNNQGGTSSGSGSAASPNGSSAQ